MSDTITLVGAKGGQGTTTLAVATAIVRSGRESTLLVGDASELCAVLGLADRGEKVIDVTGSLRVVDNSVAFEAIVRFNPEVAVRDGGSLDHPADGLMDPGDTVLVLRPCFLAMKRALAGQPYSRVAMVMEPDRVLGAADAVDILGADVVEVPFDPAVARGIDAGLLAMRLPRSLRTAVLALIGAEAEAA